MFFFTFRTTDDSYQEEDIISKSTINSPHNLNSYISFTLREDSIDCLDKVLSTNFDDKDVSAGHRFYQKPTLFRL